MLPVGQLQYIRAPRVLKQTNNAKLQDVQVSTSVSAQLTEP